MTNNYKHRPGEKFGKLTILSRTKIKQNNGKYIYYATYECECGVVKTCQLGSLISGRIKSCGCSQYEKPSGKNNPLFTGYKEISGKFWGFWKRRAISKNIEFTIDIKDAWDLYEKQDRKCALTDMPISFDEKNNGTHTASLDRIDSLKGYTMNNVQWLHKDVNIMKNKYNMEYFINMCKLISSLHKI